MTTPRKWRLPRGAAGKYELRMKQRETPANGVMSGVPSDSKVRQFGRNRRAEVVSSSEVETILDLHTKAG